MRILYIHQYFNTRSGAGSTRSYEFARRWVKSGHEVILITAARDSAVQTRVFRRTIEGIQVFYVHVPYSNYMSFQRRLVAFFTFMVWATWIGIRHLAQIDVVYATSTPLTVGIPGYLLSVWKRVPFVFEIRDLWPEAPVQLGVLRNPLAIALARWLERFLYRAAAHIVTLSPGMLEAVAKTGVPRSKLSVIPNCADLDLFRPEKAPRELTAKYCAEGKFVSVYTGAMGVANGLSVILEAAKTLAERGQHDIRFFLVGDGGQRPALEEQITRDALANVRLLPRMPKSELATFMTLSDLCLVIFARHRVLQTCSPNKLFDALALGRPVLINFGGWMQELLKEHNAGIAVPSNDPHEIADAIIKLRSQPDLVAEMGRNARALAEREFDRVKLSEELRLTLESVVSARQSNR